MIRIDWPQQSEIHNSLNGWLFCFWGWAVKEQNDK